MEVVAKSNTIRISPKKILPVANMVRSLPVSKALIILNLTYKKAGSLLAKTISSAIANASHNYGIKQDGLYIKKIDIGSGPTYKRYRPAARGRAHQILKRTANISVVLESKSDVKPAKELEGKITAEIENKSDTKQLK
jgi:large subunit ribosomal protein L22